MIQDFLIVIQLVILEGLLSFDNALALAALVETRLTDPVARRRALTWGIWGAYLFRTIVIFVGVWIMREPWAKALAGGYLLWLSFSELCLKKKEPEKEKGGTGIILRLSPLWNTIVAVELMDIMFSVDSIGVALVLSKKTWVLILGAVLGILMMRLAAQFFIILIQRFPILIKTAFVLVALAGMNIILEIKNLQIPFTGGYLLTLDKAIPEHPFLGILFVVFFGSILLNWMFPEKFVAKETL